MSKFGEGRDSSACSTPLLPNPATSSSSFSQELKEAFRLLQQPRQKGQLAPPWSVFISRCSAGSAFLKT